VLPLLRRKLDELETHIKVIFLPRSTSIVPEHSSLKGPTLALALRREAEDEGGVAIEIVIEEKVMPLNQRMVGLQTGAVPGDIRQPPLHLPGARPLGNSVPDVKLHIDRCYMARKLATFKAKILPDIHNHIRSRKG
jgi:hypothetical protein